MSIKISGVQQLKLIDCFQLIKLISSMSAVFYKQTCSCFCIDIAYPWLWSCPSACVVQALGKCLSEGVIWKVCHELLDISFVFRDLLTYFMQYIFVLVQIMQYKNFRCPFYGNIRKNILATFQFQNCLNITFELLFTRKT